MFLSPIVKRLWLIAEFMDPVAPRPTRKVVTYLRKTPLLFAFGIWFPLASLSAQTVEAVDDGLWYAGIVDLEPRLPTEIPPTKLAPAEINVPVQPRAPQASDADASATQDPDDGSIAVNAIAIEGLDLIDQSVFASTIEQTAGLRLDRDQLAALTQQIADLARDQGYIFASAYIPEQDTDLGILRVRVDEGRVDEIRISGDERDAVEVRKMLVSLIGTQATRASIERRLLLVNDLPGLYVREPTFLREDGLNILSLEVGRRDNAGRVAVNNYGTENFGPVRAAVTTDFYRLLDISDHLETSLRINPLEPSELLYAGAEYSIDLNDQGLRADIAASAGKTDTSYSFANITGDSIYANAALTYPLMRSRAASVWGTLSASHLDIRRRSRGQVYRNDVTTILTAELTGRFKFIGGWFDLGGQYSQGIDALGATQVRDPAQAATIADGIFSKAELFASWRGELTKKLRLNLSARGQLASGKLPFSQELSIGGAYTVRGFDFSEVNGENGGYALAELSYSVRRPWEWMQSIEAYAFIDGGYVRNLGDRRGGTLISAGPGLRADTGSIDLEVEAALPVNRDRESSGDRSPKWNVSLGLDF